MQVAEYRIPRYIRFVKDFERTVVGKVKKYRLVEQMQQELGTRTDDGDKNKQLATQEAAGLFKEVAISGKVTTAIGSQTVQMT